MMRLFGLLVWRDLSHAYGFGGRGGTRRGGFLLPVIFFLAVAAIYPFAVGPDAPLLARTGSGVIWVAALLAAILPLDRLVAPDADTGFFDQWAVRGISEEWVMLARIAAHWLSFGPPLMLAAVIAAGLLGLTPVQLVAIEAGLAIGTPGLAALGVMIAALTAGLKGGSALGGLMLLPLAVPMLIFGAGAARAGGGGSGLLLLGAASLVLLAIAPFAAGAAIRAMRE